jgi:hypothetical protein
MRRISSQWTFFYKRIFPTIWFGFLAVFFIIGLTSVKGKETPWPLLVVPVVMAVFGFLLMTRLIFDLVDEVWETENQLVIKNKDIEERIFFLIFNM